jgi:hypothetical protein
MWGLPAQTQFQLHAGIFRGQFWDFCPSRRWSFDTRSVTESPHIIQDIFVMDWVQPSGSYRMALQMSSRSTSGWSMLSHCVHLVVPWICKTQTAYLYGVRNRGEHLEDASYVIDDTDSDESVIEEWDPTILLGTPYNIIMII